VTRQQLFVLVRVAAGAAIAFVIARAAALQVGADHRAGWDVDNTGAPDGDPDGETIAEMLELVTGAGVFITVVAVVAVLEFGLWLLRRDAARNSG
jgi:hypothetical protein